MLLKLNKPKQLVNSLANLPAPVSPDTEAVANIFLDGHFRKQCIGLKDHAHSTFPGRKVGYVFTVKYDPARIGLFQTGDNSKNGRLSTS